LFTESSDLLGDQGEMMGKHIVGSALATWAKDDPMGALEWVRKNGETHPELVNDETKASLLSGVASKDPALAFELLGKLYGKADSDSEIQSASAISRITGAARTPEERTATLAALRAYAATLQDPKQRQRIIDRGLESLAFGGGYRNTGFESTTTWLDSANLTPKELDAATQNIGHTVRLADTGRWIEWLGGSGLPEEGANQRIHRLAAEWTREDYQAAGQWLATAPDSTAKQTAVQAYAQTVFPYEPDIAVQWANTLPAGKTRQQTFEAIHKSMPRNSDAEKAAAEAFATEHGIEKP
ncbi:MAG: hypothetical protein KDN05_10720, partial [Verrucomicrobiae bacterium]|nr:hypothetical protein [Verrucomicrobiae bacterium]